MASILWSDVEAFAPELSTIDTVAQTGILAFVNTGLNIDILGGEAHAQLRMARIYLAAHFGTLSSQGGAAAAGPVTSESEGGVSRSYANLMSSGGGALGSTSYGQLYEFIVRTSPARYPFVI